MKTIVLLKPKPGTTLEEIGAVLPREEPILWSYIASGTVRAVHYDDAVPGGVALEFETADVEEAKRLVAAFPLVAEGLHEAEFHPLTPYTGLSLLFTPEAGFVPAPPRTWAS